MNIIPLLFFLTIAINDTSGIINDNQTNYSNGAIVNQSQINDIQTDYNNGIIISRKSELLDSELIVTPTITSTPIATSVSTSSGGTSGGGSSGGSGGITSSEDFKNILQFETHENTLLVNRPISYKFKLPIYEVLITGKENEYDVSVRIELLKDKPNKATTKLDSEIIQYFNVITSTKKLKEAVIRFKTDTPSYLLKWNNSEWVKLDMVENVEDAGLKIPQECIDEQQICYTYQTDSFSSFAIVKSVAVSSNSLVQSLVVSTAIISTPKPTTSNPINQAPSIGIIGVICAMLIIKTKYYKNK